ncbi:MAG: TatD family hydrolase [Chloroflexota bacterium]|nr:MAG: hydrolase TatD [Chloroflexota bacterium]
MASSPRKGPLLPDTHAHLDDPAFQDDLTSVLVRAVRAGVGPILAVGSGFESSRRALSIAHEHDHVYAAVGLHPHHADRFATEAGGLRALLSEHRVVAVGEIGLDYFRQLSPRDVQIDAFREQLSWAGTVGIPVSVHNRDADSDVLSCLKDFDGAVVLHCFAGSVSFAQSAVSNGYYLSFAGNLTFPRADELRRVARVVPLDRLLVETDSPVLAPQVVRGRRNEPAHVVSVAATLAEIHDVPIEVLTSSVADNAARVFSWRAA